MQLLILTCMFITILLYTYVYQAMGHEFHPGTVFLCAVEAVKSVHRVYTSMHELFNKFQGQVLPDTVNYVLMEDESMLQLLEDLLSFRLTSYPNVPLPDALTRLAGDLLQAAVKVGSGGREVNSYTRTVFIVHVH